MNSKLRFHLLPNAHIDPVWLWDWREGLTEGITTVRTVLNLMDEYPELTFLRGEAVIYRHIQRHAPAVFERILDRVKAGAKAKPFIANSQWRIGLSHKNELNIRHQGKNFLAGKNRMRLIVVEDPWGSWGGMDEKPESFCLDQIQEEWRIFESHILESGPERSRLWTRWEGRRSWMELTFDLCREQEWIKVQGHLLWNQRSARLQLVLPSKGAATCDVPGGRVERSQRGQVPVARWFSRTTLEGPPTRIGVATDVLGDADFLQHETRLTLARASRYAMTCAPTRKNNPGYPRSIAAN
jgi:Glycosyl hydrolases family 38 N-terminal domain